MAVRMTLEEVMRPIEGVTCGRCGRTDCVIYPDLGKGAMYCPTCSVSKEANDDRG